MEVKERKEGEDGYVTGKQKSRLIKQHKRHRKKTNGFQVYERNRHGYYALESREHRPRFQGLIMPAIRQAIIAVSILCFLSSGCTIVRNFILLRSYEPSLADSNQLDTTVTKVGQNRDGRGREAKLLSAFFGLDDALPKFSNAAVCPGADGKDGMPVIFSHEINVSTMQAGDFRVRTASGKSYGIHCVTLAPADDKGELRTALLAGHYGSIDDQPVMVEIVGNILSIDDAVNFKGAKVKVTPLEAGPALVRAEVVPKNEWYLGRAATRLPWGGGSGCPAATKQIIRVVWAGGVTKPGGREVGDAERLRYRVKVLQGDGSSKEVVPFALADLGDGDNNHKLCLHVTGIPRSVYFPAGFMTDPRDDLNPETTIAVTRY